MAVKIWGDFEIYLDRLLGRGGMGAVYMGRQVSLDRPAAIKVLKKDLTANPEFVKRFQREAALLARLVDNHVVQVFAAGEADGEHYYAMEYVEGEDFASRIRHGHKFTPDEVLKVAHSVAMALQSAWRHRIIHRDIKPSNILITKESEVKVMDFGLAKNPESDLTQSEVIMGTAKYMSPEQATGSSCDIRSDLYSLGVVLYELSAGHAPFTGEGATAIMYQHVHQKPRPPREINPAIPEDLERVILRLLEKNPDARYNSPDALIAAVRGVQDGVTPDERSTLYNETILQGAGAPPTREPAPPSSLPPAPRRSSPAPLVASIVAVVLLLGVGGYFVLDVLHQDPVPAPLPPPFSRGSSTADASVPVPAGSASWEEQRRRGLEAFGARQWVMAYTLLDEAEKRGASDVAEKKLQARANEQIEKAEAEVDDEAALQHFEAARKFFDDEALRQRIRSVSFRRWRRSAEKHEGGDWSKAADDWKRAAEFADDGQVEEVRERQKFCARFSDAVTARATKDWKKAHEIYRELAKNPRGYSEAIEQEIQRAEKELNVSAEMAAKELRKEFDELGESGRKAYRRAAWAEAKAYFERANDAKYNGFPREEAAKALAELAVALSAPAGMAYVPAGQFTMGGGRPVEGPEGEAATGAFFIDDHEVTVAEYAEFLKAVEASRHHPGCPKDEPPGKSHAPLDADSQKAEDAVSGVDWYDAASYAAWKRKRLPREAEWEKAAAFDPAGRRIYPWGPKYQKEGGKSYLGLDGMGSGVLEWTADWFKKYPWSGADHVDFGERKKVLRGGVLLVEDAAENARVTYRHWYPPSLRSRKAGFRCAQDVPER